MSDNPMWDKLQPLRATMPRTVANTEVLRVAGALLGNDPVKSAKDARQEVLRWVQKRCGGKLPQEAWNFAEFDYFVGGRNSAGVRIQSDVSDIWAIRADDPDKTVARRVWTIEVVIGHGHGKDDQSLFSARLMVSTAESNLEEVLPHAPGFVQQVVETVGLTRGKFPISAEPWIIQSKSDYSELSEGLMDESRQLPFIVLTVPDNSEKPLIDASALARATLGLALVVVVPAEFTWKLTHDFGRPHSVFGGAVRAYLPGFSPDESPYSHRLVVANRLLDKEGQNQCIRLMRILVAKESIHRTQINRDILTFAAVRNASLRLQQEQMGDASESEQLVIAESQIETLEKELGEGKVELDYFDSEHKNAIKRAEAAEEQARSSGYRIQQLTDRLKAKGEAVSIESALPETWLQFTKWVDENLVGLVILTPRARKSTKNPQFQDIDLAVCSLKWLANTGREHFIRGGGSIREAEVVAGLRNAHCGSDQFEFDWQGNKYIADWHIKKGGNTRDPSKCLRIYYCWDDVGQQVVIADLPAHRRTGAT